MLSWFQKFFTVTSPKGIMTLRDYIIAHVVGIGTPLLMFAGNLIIALAESLITHAPLWQSVLPPIYYLIAGILATALTSSIRMYRGQ